MDRLPAVIAVALAACACSKDEPTPPAPPRVEGAQVLGRKDASAAGFCDVHVPDESGPVLTFPPLAGPSPAAAAPGHWRWLNVWATWCKPCVEELPRLARWRERLVTAGRPVDLAFVSVDDSSADVAAFRKLHPEMPDSARLADPNKQAAWFTALGLDAASPIPIHVFVSPAGHIRCVRAGGVSERDYAVIEGLLGE
jgi:thiol-disulfide isomerase/thioredoxin